MEERINGDPREIKFGGEGKAESIGRGFAITTLRNPKTDYNFSCGERILADCFDDGERVPVTVITNEIRALEGFSIPQLALDGFFSVPMVKNEMKSYPGYEKINKKSIMQAITFVKQKSFDVLTQDVKGEILFGHFDVLVKMQELRHLFFPTMCRHLLDYGGVQDWVDFLDVHKLISKREKLKMENYKYRGMKDTWRFVNDHPELLQGFSLDPTHPAFKPLVLGIFNK